LGHFKKKFGIEREKAPFVFTPQFANVLGGKNSPVYKKFEDICCQAYNLVRKNSILFINLFYTMLSVGLPELQTVEDIMFLRDKLALGKTETEAANALKELIDESLKTKTTQFMDMLHIFVN